MTSHLLAQLTLPDRYERLVDRLGPEVANLLMAPSAQNLDSLSLLAEEVRTRDEGVFIPLYGRTGVGKTTFAMNATQWLPSDYGPSLQYEGEISHEGLVNAVVNFVRPMPANFQKIVPVNIDHREGNAPTEGELSVIKRFLRTKAGGVHSIVFWPETSEEISRSLSSRYIDIAGQLSIPLPLVCEGPPKETWRDVAKHTLSITNKISNLDGLGANPDDYNPVEFSTLGNFLRKISHDFNVKVKALRSEMERPVSIIIVFVSESADPGVLSQLTTPSRYGLLDAHALVSVTSESEMGKWWSGRRGLLTRTIVQLDAHALCLAPTAAASCIRNFSDSMKLFDDAGYRRYGPARAVRDLGRSDLGKLVCNQDLSRFEARGLPGDDATAAFQLLAEAGFNLGKDKNLNQIMKSAIEGILAENKTAVDDVTAEKKLPFCALIPDNAIHYPDHVQCIEYTWRKGDFLDSGNRSTVAQYILRKLQTYARQLNWTND